CASAIMQSEPWLVTDARVDPRVLANPLVASEFGLRFYAGAPLTTHDGFNLGTLCVIDRQPREVTEDEVATLRDLAALVMDELELRRSARRAVGLESDLRTAAENVARSLQASLLPPRLPDLPGIDVAARYHVAYRDQVGGDFYDLVATEEGYLAVVGDACGKGTSAASLTGMARWALRTIALDHWTPSSALAKLNNVIDSADETDRRYCTLAVACLRPFVRSAAEPSARAAEGTVGAGSDVGAALEHLDVSISLAGHPAPLVVRLDGTVEPIGLTSPLLGWQSDVSFEQCEEQLYPGDVLVMFTDGLIEALRHRDIGSDALRNVLLRLGGGRSAEEVAEHLDAEVGVGSLRDDASFLVVRCL
ncbi:MAG: PP2C family protein-serine/threonine phosphatase, partial [Acidimicrobiales bacterium]